MLIFDVKENEKTRITDSY